MKQPAVLPFVFATLLACDGVAQVTLEGKVWSGKAPLPGASVYLQDSYDGTVTDFEGRFAFETEETGTWTLVVEFLGYAPHRMQVKLDGPVASLDVELKEVYNEMRAATIQAGSFAAGEAHRTAVLKPLDIVTTAGSNGNVVGALQTLPGTTPVGESGRLFVRGGAADETQIYVDGMRVLQPYTSAVPQTQVRGRFNPFLFSGTQFSTGGFSAEFGNAMSAVLQLETDDPPAEDALNIAVMSVGADVTANRKWENGGVLASLNYINLTPTMAAIPQNFEWCRAPESLEGVVRLGQTTASGGNLRVLVQGTYSEFEMGRTAVGEVRSTERISLGNRCAFASVVWTQPLNERWIVDAGTSLNANRDLLNYDDLKVEGDHVGVFSKVKFTRLLAPGFKLRAGVVTTLEHFTEASGFASDALQDVQSSWAHPAAFAELDGHLGNDWAWRAGVRSEYATALDAWNLAPRVSLGWQPGEHGSWSLAAGRFYQAPDRAWLSAPGSPQFAYADQLLMNWQSQVSGRVVRLEAYGKQYHQLLTHDTGLYGEPVAIAAGGQGYAWGVEGFIRDNKTIPQFDYWVSYSYLDARRQYLDQPELAVPGFASAHVASLVGKYWVDHWRSQIGITCQVASARPFDNPNTPEYNDGRTDVYRTVDANWSFLWRPHVIFHASVSNVFGFKNSFGARFSSTPDANGHYASQPVLPASNRFAFVGCFITFSRDKSSNQLDKI